jgi:hypothetical protein
MEYLLIIAQEQNLVLIDGFSEPLHIIIKVRHKSIFIRLITVKNMDAENNLQVLVFISQ